MLRATAVSESPRSAKKALISLVDIAYSRGVTKCDSERHLKHGVELCQGNSSTGVESLRFGERVARAFGTTKPAEIARKLEITYQGAKNYLEDRIPAPDTLIAISRST